MTAGGTSWRQRPAARGGDKSSSERDLTGFGGLAPALLGNSVGMSPLMLIRWLSENLSAEPAALLAVGLVLVVLIVLASDDDLPGPRRCFARAAGATSKG